MKHVMYIGYAKWGDEIEFSGNDNTSIIGHKPYYFSEGSVVFDYVNNKYNEYIPLYYVKNVSWFDDPHDMFRADVELIGKVKNTTLNKIRLKRSWFVNPCKELLAQMEKEYKDTSFFHFSKRHTIKKFIDVLKMLTK